VELLRRGLRGLARFAAPDEQRDRQTATNQMTSPLHDDPDDTSTACEPEPAFRPGDEEAPAVTWP
jgi:hypothetical protein